MSANVPRVIRSSGQVARSMTATGSDEGRPAATSCSHVVGNVATPMRMTMVPPAAATAAQSTGAPSLDSPSWPVTSVAVEAQSRWVNGMPAAAGAATAEVTPGTTSQGIPAAATSAISSAAASEHERIATLEPADGPPGSRMLDDLRVDPGL